MENGTQSLLWWTGNSSATVNQKLSKGELKGGLGSNHHLVSVRVSPAHGCPTLVFHIHPPASADLLMQVCPHSDGLNKVNRSGGRCWGSGLGGPALASIKSCQQFGDGWFSNPVKVFCGDYREIKFSSGVFRSVPGRVQKCWHTVMWVGTIWDRLSSVKKQNKKKTNAMPKMAATRQ